MIIVGVIGRQAAGKNEVVDYLAERENMPTFAAGDIVRKLAEEEGVAPTREKLLDVAAEILSRRGKTYIADTLIRRIEAAAVTAAAVNGLHTPADVSRFREAFGDAFLAVAVTVSHPETRYQRAKDRDAPRDRDDFDSFLRNDRAEDRLFDMDRTLEMADVTIPNDGSVDDLHSNIEAEVIQRLGQHNPGASR